MKDLKSLADEAKQKVGSGVVAIAAASEDGKASIVVAVTPDLTSRFNAVELVRLGSAALGGKGGGGRPDMAQAGGPDGAKTHEALAAVEEGLRRAAGATVARAAREVQAAIAFLRFSSTLSRKPSVESHRCSGPTRSARSLVIEPDSTVSTHTRSRVEANLASA